jgi:hypothetical protein
MVLDAEALTWAATNDIDTPKLKKARVPIYGKWYFPEIPAGVPLVNLESGEQQVFADRMVAGGGSSCQRRSAPGGPLAPGFAVMPASPAVAEAAPGRWSRWRGAVAAMARPPGWRSASMELVRWDGRHAGRRRRGWRGSHAGAASPPFVGVGSHLLLRPDHQSDHLVIGLVWMLVAAWVVPRGHARAARPRG